MNQAIESQPINVPADVQSYAIEKGLDGYLPAVLAAARRAFPTAGLRLYLEPDYFDPELRFIVIAFSNLPMTIEEAHAAKDLYYRGLLTCVPAHLAIYFTQDLEFADDPPR